MLRTELVIVQVFVLSSVGRTWDLQVQFICCVFRPKLCNGTLRFETLINRFDLSLTYGLLLFEVIFRLVHQAL